MDIMKRRLLYAIAIATLVTLPSMASIAPEETTDAEYLINAGYSQATAEDVFIMKNRATGRPIEPLYDKSQNTFVKGLKKIYAYIDPAVEAPDKIHHDIQLSPSFSDL